MIFEISVKLEIGRKFENSLKSASGFFRDGDKAATFNALGILLVVRDKLINLVIVVWDPYRQDQIDATLMKLCYRDISH